MPPCILRHIAAPAALLGLAFLSPQNIARAQSTTTYRTSASFGGINYEYAGLPTGVLNGSYDFGGSFLNTSGEASYSFGDGAGAAFGAEDTIRISGSGTASSMGFGFTDLKAKVEANLENAYLDLRNIENALTSELGQNAPYTWIANVSAGWTLTSRFNSSTNNGSYTVKWVFGVDGARNSNTGGYSFAYLGFSYGTNRANFSTTSTLPQLWVTDSMPVIWANGVETSADFNANWQYNLPQDGASVFEDGTLIGYRAPLTVGGTADYYSTVKLQEIQVFDAGGNRFYDFTVDDGTGTVYYRGTAAAGGAAPEPGTMALVFVGLAAGAGLRRRRLCR